VTDSYASGFATDDIDDEDSSTTRLDREASAYLTETEGRAFTPTTSIRQAVREDMDHGRQWARARIEATRDAMVDRPLATAAYAVGAGVLIGLLLRR